MSSMQFGKINDKTKEHRSTGHVFQAYSSLFITAGPPPHTGTTSVTPTSVRATGLSATSIAIGWDDPGHCPLVCGGVMGYRVEWREVSDGKLHYQDQTGGLSQAHLTGLTPFTNYSIAVAAVNKEGQVEGAYSQPLTVETNEGSEFEYNHNVYS